MAIILGLIFGFIVMLIAKPESAGGAGFKFITLGGFKRIGDVFYLQHQY